MVVVVPLLACGLPHSLCGPLPLRALDSAIAWCPSWQARRPLPPVLFSCPFNRPRSDDTFGNADICLMGASDAAQPCPERPLPLFVNVLGPTLERPPCSKLCTPMILLCEHLGQSTSVPAATTKQQSIATMGACPRASVVCTPSSACNTPQARCAVGHVREHVPFAFGPGCLEDMRSRSSVPMCALCLVVP